MQVERRLTLKKKAELSWRIVRVPLCRIGPSPMNGFEACEYEYFLKSFVVTCVVTVNPTRQV